MYKLAYTNPATSKMAKTKRRNKGRAWIMQRETNDGLSRKSDKDVTFNSWPSRAIKQTPRSENDNGTSPDRALLKDYLQPVIVKMLRPFNEDVEGGGERRVISPERTNAVPQPCQAGDCIPIHAETLNHA